MRHTHRTNAWCRLVFRVARWAPWCRASGFALRTARDAVRRGFRLRKPERSEARGGDASQQAGKLDFIPFKLLLCRICRKHTRKRPNTSARGGERPLGPLSAASVANNAHDMPISFGRWASRSLAIQSQRQQRVFLLSKRQKFGSLLSASRGSVRFAAAFALI